MSALPRRGDPLRALARPGGLAALAITAFAALLSVEAADGPWLAELGRVIADRGGIPDGVPYASAVTDGWPNVPVLGELIFALLSTLGSRGVQIAQVAAVAGTLALLARDARRSGARERALAIALLLLVPACFGPFVAIRGPALLAPAVRRLRAAAALGGAGAFAPHLAARPAARRVGEPARRRAHRRGRRRRLPRLRARPAAPARERRRGARLRAGAVRQPGALEHAGVRARRAAERGRAPGHRPVGAAQPGRLAGRGVRARGGAAARRRAPLTAQAVGDRRARRPRAADGARRARRHVARALRRPARRHGLRRRRRAPAACRASRARSRSRSSRWC